MPKEHELVEGFDAAAIEPWLEASTGLIPPIFWNRLTGGHSNLTYELTDANLRQVVIRRPPIGSLLPRAHDMRREYRILECLSTTGVPVAEPIAFCDDAGVTQAPFYVMSKVSGMPLQSGAAVDGWLPFEARRRASEEFFDVLATLHSIEPSTVGLDDLGPPHGYVARQLRTWYDAWNRQVESAAYDDPRIHQLHARLQQRLPDDGPARIVHGDFGPHNVLFSAGGRVMAVLDWELATIGDPLADCAYSVNAWVERGDPGVYGQDPPTALLGFLRRSDLVERYAAATRLDVSDLDFFRGFNCWKLACILHGVYARYRTGQKSADGVDTRDLFDRMQALIGAAARLA